MKGRLLAIATVLALTVGTAIALTPEAPPVHYVVFHSPGPAWKTDVPFREQPGLDGHIAHYRTLHAEGKLLLGGPFLDDSGGMMVPVPTESRESIEAFAAADPAVKSGVLRYEVKPWLIGMSGLDAPKR